MSTGHRSARSFPIMADGLFAPACFSLRCSHHTSPSCLLPLCFTLHVRLLLCGSLHRSFSLSLLSSPSSPPRSFTSSVYLSVSLKSLRLFFLSSVFLRTISVSLCFLWEVTWFDEATSSASPCHLDVVPVSVCVCVCALWTQPTSVLCVCVCLEHVCVYRVDRDAGACHLVCMWVCLFSSVIFD